MLFDYSGTESGLFSSIAQDSISSGFSFNQSNQDSSFFLMASITQQENNEFDLFLAALQDTVFPLQPRTWDIPGEGDEDNPLSLETLLIFMPGLDSSFVMEVFDAFTDTSSFDDTTDVFTDFFTNFSENLYLGLSGTVEIESVSDSSILGSFNTIMIKPAFYFPPHTIFINNGEFAFYDVDISVLENSTVNTVPKDFGLHKIYPNPFSDFIQINYGIFHKAKVSIQVFDIQGNLVAKLQELNLDPEKYTAEWRPDSNIRSGHYFVALKINDVQVHYLKVIKQP